MGNRTKPIVGKSVRGRRRGRVAVARVGLVRLEPRVLLSALSFATQRADYTVGTSPSAVGAADLNGDGRLDLAVANGSASSVSILLADGAGEYGAKTDYPTGRYGSGSNSSGVATGDFNGDGKMDVAVSNLTDDTVSVFFGNGIGGLGTAKNVTVGRGPSGVIAADFNGDGKLDLVTANRNSGFVGNVSVLLGDGAGNFATHVEYGADSLAYALTSADFNRDGKLDLAVANDGNGTASILLGDGAGGFGLKTNYSIGGYAQSITAGDFNGDGKSDLAVPNFQDGTISVVLGDGAGGFGSRATFATGYSPLSIASGDFNGDGEVDLVVANRSSNTVSLFAGNGLGSFAAKRDFVPGNAPLFVLAKDLNGDGKLDIAAANQIDNTVSVLRGNGDGTFGYTTDFAAGDYPYGLAPGDLNGDGTLDLAVANGLNGTGTVTRLIGAGGGAFGAPGGVSMYLTPESVALGDFNGDGRLDLVSANQQGSNLSVRLATSAGGYGGRTDYATSFSPVSVITADFNGDRKLDIASVCSNSAGPLSVFPGTGTGTFGARADFPTGSSPYQLAAADFNGDGNVDIATANGGSNNVSVLLGTGTGSFAAATNYAVGGAPYGLVAGDFNGDGKVDLVTANNQSNRVSVLLGNGAGGFGTKTDFPAGTSPTALAAGDFNGDTIRDLAVVDYGDSSVSVLLGNGSGGFAPRLTFAAGHGHKGVVVADFDIDGRPDIATTNYYDSTVTVLRNTTAPKFSGISVGAGGKYNITWDFAAYTVHVTAGTVNVGADPGAGGLQVNLDVAAGATAVLNAYGRFGSIHAAAGGTVVVPPTTGGTGTVWATQVVLEAGAKMDLASNDLIVDYTGGTSPRAVIEGLVGTGYHGGNWLGNGITSSVAAGNTGLYSVAVLDNVARPTPFESFDGIDTSSHQQILVKFTWVDDLDLDGQVTSNDSIVFANNYAEGASATHRVGDLNYNGVFDSNDAILFANAYNESLKQTFVAAGSVSASQAVEGEWAPTESATRSTAVGNRTDSSSVGLRVSGSAGVRAGTTLSVTITPARAVRGGRFAFDRIRRPLAMTNLRAGPRVGHRDWSDVFAGSSGPLEGFRA